MCGPEAVIMVYYGGAFAHLQLPWPEGAEPPKPPPPPQRRRQWGRYCHYQPEFGAAYVQAIRDGAFLKDAARVIGFRQETVKGWLRSGREGSDPLLAEFYADVQQARIDMKMGQTKKIVYADDWRAALAVLERRYPKQWGQKKTLDVHASGKVDIDFSRFKTVDEAYAAADTVETMRATVLHDMKRRAQLRKQLEKQPNGDGPQADG